jgi:hypothetical protein
MTLTLVGFGRGVWNIASYFVIPILIFEGTELRTCLRRSLQLLTGTWKELFIFKFIFMALIVAAFLALALALQALGLGDMPPEREYLLIPPVVLIAVLLGGIETVFSAVLYSYAITGMSPEEFSGYPPATVEAL